MRIIFLATAFFSIACESKGDDTSTEYDPYTTNDTGSWLLDSGSPEADLATPSTAALDATVSSTGTDGSETHTYDLNYSFIVFDELGNSVDSADGLIRGFSDAAWVIETSGLHDCTLNWVETTASSVTVPLVMDQSGSISSTDPSDVRVPAAKEFLSSLTSSDESGMVSFASGNSCVEYDVASWNIGGLSFISDHTSWFGSLDSLIGCEGGGTPLFDAVYGAIDLINSAGTKEAKAAVVFTDGEDSGSSTTESTMSAHAVSSDVRLFTIGLSSGVNHEVLSRMAKQTNGAYFFAWDIGPAISAFRGMNQLLVGGYWQYDCTDTLTTSTTTSETLDWITTDIEVTYGGWTMYAPVFIDF